jgi:rhamnopyranosyl-N-acetylglucosaminyl-diphospho-decaprenol beta-1,3/1,4-galactofuranosyltransferase
VVTYNRRELLVDCLAALADQTCPVDHVLVVDNASTDGTAKLLRDHYADQVELVTLPVNEGGAGGFHEGLRLGHAAGHEWLWLMDDDTAPTPTALQELLRASKLPGVPPASLLASKVVWNDDTLHPMNRPDIENGRTAALIEACEHGLMPLRTATFVSLMVHRGVIERHGLPLKRYFLWSDDVEYTARVLRTEPGFFVADSVALHATVKPYNAFNSSGDRFYFHVRNTLYMLRGPAYAPRDKPGIVLRLVLGVISYLRHNRLGARNVRIVLRGARDGLRRGAPVAARP